MNGRYQRIESPAMGRKVHLWSYGWYGPPVIAFPTAAGFAHEWQSQGMIEALAPLLAAGKMKLYCPESNVAEAWTRKDGSPESRLARHAAYERFVLDTLIPHIGRDCHLDNPRVAVVGASLGGSYAANFALKHPDRVWWGLCLSGRYQMKNFIERYDGADLYFNNPLAYVPNLHGQALERVRRQARLTLVCGQGKFEEGCIEETRMLAHVLRTKQVPVEEDIWGHDVKHDWDWWKRQANYHFRRVL